MKRSHDISKRYKKTWRHMDPGTLCSEYIHVLTTFPCSAEIWNIGQSTTDNTEKQMPRLRLRSRIQISMRFRIIFYCFLIKVSQSGFNIQKYLPDIGKMRGFSGFWFNECQFSVSFFCCFVFYNVNLIYCGEI